MTIQQKLVEEMLRLCDNTNCSRELVKECVLFLREKIGNKLNTNSRITYILSRTKQIADIINNEMFENGYKSIQETLFCISNGINKPPLCRCGKNLDFKCYSDGGYGKTCGNKKCITEESIRRQTGKKLSPELIEKMRIRATGKKLSPESIEKMKNTYKMGNHKQTEEQKSHLRQMMLGKTLSLEIKTKIKAKSDAAVKRNLEKDPNYYRKLLANAVEIARSPEVAEKRKATLMRNHGVDNPGKLLEFKRYSKISQKLFWEIKEKSGIDDCYFYEHGGEQRIWDGNNVMTVDFVYKNLIVEFNGDIFHANPQKFNANDLVPPQKRYKAHEIWERDKNRTNFLKQLGYDVVVVWESDYKRDSKRIVNEICEKIYELSGFKQINEWEVLTPDGWSDFKGIKVSGSKESVTIKTEKSNLKCTNDHLVKVKNGKFLKAKSIDTYHEIITEKGIEKVEEVNRSIKYDIYFDLVQVEKQNQYFTNGILSHNCLILDEYAFVPSGMADEFMSSVYPTIISGKTTKMIVVSTPDGLNSFYDIWIGAVNRENTFFPVRIDWWEVPGRDEAWKQKVIKDIGLVKFNQEFGNKFLGSSNTLIEGDIIVGLKPSEPKEIKWNGALQIHETPVESATYVIGADASRGLGKDYGVLQVLKINGLHDVVQVAIYRDNKISPENLAKRCVEIAKFYNNAYILAENNGKEGDRFVRTVWETCEYENLITTGKKKDQLGIESNVKTKYDSNTMLKKYLENSWLKINDRTTRDEIGKYEEVKPNVYKCGDTKGHDDCVTSLAWGIYSMELITELGIIFDPKTNKVVKEQDADLYEDQDDIEHAGAIVIYDGDMEESGSEYENGEYLSYGWQWPTQ